MGRCVWCVSCESSSSRMLTLGPAILFLCSKEARWITGLIMPVDAGVRKLLQVIDDSR